MKSSKRQRTGQVLILVTFSLVVMSGLVGLAVDLGWSYFRRKAAQSAVDSASLSSAQAVLEAVGEEGPWDCSFGMTCQEITPCPSPVSSPPTNNIEVGCLYAEKNGFAMGGGGGRQLVLMRAGAASSPPTAPGVAANYWVTATAQEAIPQLFSAVMGNTWGNSGARATAAIIDSVVPGSLILLNRENDCLPMDTSNSLVCGVDALIQANNNQGLNALMAEGGILMASTKNGTGDDERFAGENTGGELYRPPLPIYAAPEATRFPAAQPGSPRRKTGRPTGATSRILCEARGSLRPRVD